jgi:hypothetical protein
MPPNVRTREHYEGKTAWLFCDCQKNNPEGRATLHNKTVEGKNRPAWRCTVCGHERD